MNNPLFDLTGRTALVTGSCRGLGRAMAEGLARAGAHVIVNGVDAARVKAAADGAARGGAVGRGPGFDVTDEPPSCAPSPGSTRRGVAVDILVNNAGIQLRKPMVDLSTAEWHRVIDTNLTSAFVIGREAARRMMARKRGKIINIGSLTSDLARATVAPYTVAKGGIKMLTRAMAAEWAEHGIQANAIGPGYMVTDMNQALIDNPAFDAWVKGRTPAKRWGKPRGAGRRGRVPGRRRHPTTSTARSSTSTVGSRLSCSAAALDHASTRPHPRRPEHEHPPRTACHGQTTGAGQRTERKPAALTAATKRTLP